MDGVPSPLQIGSPVTERGFGQWEARPPLVRKNTSGSSRLSQLFPSRPSSSVSSASRHEPSAGSRRTSYPSPLVSGPGSQRTTSGPAPPPLPVFSGSTAYEPSASPIEYQCVPATLSQSNSNRNNKNLFSGFISLRGTSYQRGDYSRIDDEESFTGLGRLGSLQEGNESIAHLQGGADTIQMGRIGATVTTAGTNDNMDQHHNLSEAGYAAEYERLETQLGAGMSSVTERPFTYNPGPSAPGSYARQPRSEPNVGASTIQALNAQEEAEKTGDIVAIAGIPVDISDSFGGGDFEARSIIGDSISSNNEMQRSYFFPKGQFESVMPTLSSPRPPDPRKFDFVRPR